LFILFLHLATRDELDNDELNDKRPRRLYEKMENVFTRYILLNHVCRMTCLSVFQTFNHVAAIGLISNAPCIALGIILKDDHFRIKSEMKIKMIFKRAQYLF